MRDDFVIYSNIMNRRADSGQNAQLEIQFLEVKNNGAANTAVSSSSAYHSAAASSSSYNPSAVASSSNSNPSAAASASSFNPSAAASSSSAAASSSSANPSAAASSSDNALQYAKSNPRTSGSSKSVRGVEKSSKEPREITTAGGVTIQTKEHTSLNLTSVRWRLSAEIKGAHSERMLITEARLQMTKEPRITNHQLKVITVQVISRFNPCQECAPALAAFKQYLEARILHDKSVTYSIAYRRLWIPGENNSKYGKQVSLDEANTLCAQSAATLIANGWIWEGALNGKQEYASFANTVILNLNQLGKNKVTNDWIESTDTVNSWFYNKIREASLSSEDKKKMEDLMADFYKQMK